MKAFQLSFSGTSYKKHEKCKKCLAVAFAEATCASLSGTTLNLRIMMKMLWGHYPTTSNVAQICSNHLQLLLQSDWAHNSEANPGKLVCARNKTSESLGRYPRSLGAATMIS